MLQKIFFYIEFKTDLPHCGWPVAHQSRDERKNMRSFSQECFMCNAAPCAPIPRIPESSDPYPWVVVAALPYITMKYVRPNGWPANSQQPAAPPMCSIPILGRIRRFILPGGRRPFRTDSQKSRSRGRRHLSTWGQMACGAFLTTPYTHPLFRFSPKHSQLKAASTANYDPHVFAKTNTHGLGVWKTLAEQGWRENPGKGEGETRGAGQVFRLHFEMFPARTLRSVSLSALRVYIWQRMPGQGPPFSSVPKSTPLGKATPITFSSFLGWQLAVCLLHFYCVLCRGCSAK